MKNKNTTDKKEEIASADIAALAKKTEALDARIDGFCQKTIAENEQLTQTVKTLADTIELLCRKNEELCADVGKLRDQMFTLGMAEVSENGEVKNESYHNLILDEACALRADVDGLKTEMINLREQNGKLSVVSETDKKVEKLLSAVSEVMTAVDDVKAGLELRTLNEEEPNTEGTLKSKDQLTKSIDELKKELSKIANDFSA